MSIMKLLKKKDPTEHCSAVIVAAGSAERMGSDKMMLELCGMPVIVRTVKAFQQNALVDEIIVVTRQDKIETIAELCAGYGLSKVSKVICGGATRMESALAGVSACRRSAKLIAIHDGARPLASDELISNTVCAASKYMAAAPALKSTDTLKAVDENGFICATVDREITVRIQTPQVFDAELIKGALTKASRDGLSITDDCLAVEMMGVKSMTVAGESSNIKLTSPEDVIVAEAILAAKGDNDAYRAGV